VERALVPDLPALVPFVRPPVYAAVLSPLASKPLARAFWVWVGLQIVILAICWAWAARRFGARGVVWSAVFLPTAYGIANGQDCTMMLLAMIVAFELAERGHAGASGFAIGLALIKFHLLLLFPVLMLVSRRWRMLAGYCAAAGMEAGISLLLGGWRGMVAYARLLERKDIERLSPSPEMMSNIHAIPANFHVTSTAVSIVLAIGVVAITLAAAWGAPLWRWFAAATAGSLLMVPHVYGYDAAMLLAPALLAIFGARTRFTRYAAMALALPCVFWLPAAGRPWAMGPALAILVFLISLAAERRAGKAPEQRESVAELAVG
jgi:Glycosyltransferase family 87